MALDLQANSQTHNGVFVPIKREGFPLSFVRNFQWFLQGLLLKVD